MVDLRLESRFAKHFPALVQEHGERCYLRGEVEELELFENGAMATVRRAGKQYHVGVRFDEVDDSWFCTCRASERQPACEHVWAVLLEARASDDDARRLTPKLVGPRTLTPAARAPSWRDRLRNVERLGSSAAHDPWAALEPRARELIYAIDAQRSLAQAQFVVRLALRRRSGSGAWSAPEPLGRGTSLAGLPDDDQRVLRLLLRQAEPTTHWPEAIDTVMIGAGLAPFVLPLLCASGRAVVRGADGREESLRWDAGEAWQPRLTLADERGRTVLSASLVRGGERMELAAPAVLFSFGYLIARGTIAAFDALDAMPWIAELRARGPLEVPASQRAMLLAGAARLPARAWDGECELARAEHVSPTPHLFVDAPPRRASLAGVRLTCRVTFDYGGGEHLEPEHPAELVALDGGTRFVRRDRAGESAALAAFLEAGGRRTRRDAEDGLHGTIAASRFGAVVRALFDRGWSIEAEGVRWRRASGFHAALRSGQDWFELEGGIEFEGGARASFPELLAALRKGRTEVVLGDGSIGVLPERWLARFGLLDLSADEGKNSLRLPHQQGFLLDALLADRAELTVDAGFAAYRERIARFRGIAPASAPESFRGELRPYQRAGLGWLEFLRELGFGGCLADDMGLGKTVQVLAFLAARRQARVEDDPPTSIVVAPRSLVFNWIDEARRFTPELAVLDYTGTERERRWGEEKIDLLVTTYGTLRRDAQHLAQHEFDVVVLDEAQAIKNAASISAKAARLLRARQRLALSGTPIENHLGELWSLFEFLNPGMLGRSTTFSRFLGAGAGEGGEELAALGRAIAPFFLRRTKAEVLADLPPKSEQTLWCELEGAERRRYDELREHYRAELLRSDAAPGDFERRRIEVLEALLRLRQAACHPGLLDKSLVDSGSAKLDALVPRLTELVEEGHKVLVFSQFTSFLAIVRRRLELLGITYEYLDGRTRDRRERVERFQSARDCRVFLISLKAGGHGLNLTKADYVFLLDPWWNPAVEAQAIDRAHRMGQQHPVFAYRLIAKDTVEEKVLKLQVEKRELAQAVLSQGTSVLRDLTRKDLEQLLS